MSQLTFEGFSGEAPIPSPAESKAVKPAGRVLSHSSISMYRACPQKWKFRYIDKVPEKPKSFFSFGKSVHAGLEFLFSKREGPMPTIEEVIAHYKANWIVEGYAPGKEQQWFYNEGERILRGYYAKHNKEYPSVFQIEYKFNLEIEGVPMTGFVDRIDLTAKGGLAIVDYKTGKAFDKSRVRTDAQMTLYQIACQEVFQKPVESLTLYHLNSLTPLTVPAHSKKLEDGLRASIKASAEGIAAGKFDPKVDERGVCQWCDYKQICPAFSSRRAVAASPAPELAEKVDMLGKLDARLRDLEIERATLAGEVAGSLEVTGQSTATGKHFVVQQDNGRIISRPIDQGENNGIKS